MSSATHRICVTRAIKNLEYIERSVPTTITKEDLEELYKLSPEILVKLHTISKPHEVIKNVKLANFLENNKIPLPDTAVSQPLFNGTLVFVQVTFNRPSLPPFSISTVDLQTAINYSTLVSPLIHQYALQYGPNTINVSSNIIQFTVTLTGNTFNKADLRGWIKTIAHDNNLTNSCVVVLIDRSGPINSEADPSHGVGGYHSITDNTPFCFCNVLGHNLTIDDTNNVYAEILSHEIAEMVVDPSVNNGNPEVCDGCAFNCTNVWNNFFDNNGIYIGGSQIVPPPFAYNFFINSIMRPACIDPTNHDQCSKPGALIQRWPAYTHLLPCQVMVYWINLVLIA